MKSLLILTAITTFSGLTLAQTDSKLVCTGTECVRETTIKNVPAPKLQYSDYVVGGCYVRFEPSGKLTYMKVESKEDRRQEINFIVALEKDYVLERKKFVSYETTRNHDIKKIPCTDVEPEHMRDESIYNACLAKSSKNIYKMYCEVPRKKKDFSNF